jgi:hypothetical protein
MTMIYIGSHIRIYTFVESIRIFGDQELGAIIVIFQLVYKHTIRLSVGPKYDMRDKEYTLKYSSQGNYILYQLIHQ